MKRLTALAVSAMMLGSILPVSAQSARPENAPKPPATTVTSTKASLFSDVSVTNMNAEAITALKSEGILQGYADGSFGVDKGINRAEFLKIAMSASTGYSADAGKTCVEQKPAAVTKYADIDMEAWYAPYMCAAVEKGIMEGYPDGRMRPDSLINVPEMAKIVSLVMKVQTGAEGTNWYDKYMSALEAKKALPTSIKKLSDNVTRGQMAEIVFRVKANRTDKASLDAAELSGVPRARLATGTVGKIASCSDLSRVMETELSSQMMTSTGVLKEEMALGGDTANGGAPAMEVAAPRTDADAQTDYSSTNVQVEGVDEGDIVKNDGRYIYVIRNNGIRIIDTQSMQQVGSVRVADENFWPTDLYLEGNRLIVLGSSSEVLANQEKMAVEDSRMAIGIMPPYYRGKTLTKSILIDITDRAQPKIEREVTLDGNVSQSRRIGDKLYVVMNDQPRYWLMREAFSPVQDILPKVTDSARSTEETSLVGCDEVLYFPGYTRPDYMTVAVIPVNDKTKDVEAKVFLGNSESVYMSTEALYVTTGAADAKDLNWSWNDTQIYKFDLTDTGVEQTAAARVRGRVLNQFSMDEHKGHFRIATTRNNWDERTNQSENALYVLDGNLKQTGSITNIAPGEQIKSVRFMGDKGYIVTFKNIDPFFALDLANPTAPKVLGELKIPGWSDYLHPYDDTHIIGFGRDVDVTEETNGSGETMNWQDVKGFKMSMFDVTDMQNPKEQFTLVLGVQGTYSDVLYNHKALLFDKEKNLMAFPLNLTEPNGIKIFKTCSLDSNGKEVCEETSRYEDYKTVFDGAMVFTVDLINGFKERGRVSHYAQGFLDYTQQNIPDDEYLKRIDRVIYIGDKLYSVSQAMVKQLTMDTVRETGSVTLN